jgi:hypothetical protein
MSNQKYIPASQTNIEKRWVEEHNYVRASEQPDIKAKQQREQSWPSLVPATVTQTPIDGLKLFNDPQTGRYGSVQDIGNGQSLVNTQGAENTLRLCQYTGNGQTVCN